MMLPYVSKLLLLDFFLFSFCYTWKTAQNIGVFVFALHLFFPELVSPPAVLSRSRPAWFSKTFCHDKS